MNKDINRGPHSYIQYSIGGKDYIFPLMKGRKVIGRSSSADIVIKDTTVSSIHAVLEILNNQIRIYDMNSKNGSFVDGKKIVTSDLSLGSTFQLGQIKLTILKEKPSHAAPPSLPSLDPVKGRASVFNPPVIQEKPEENNADEVPYVVYPLGADANANYSEYIFEDTENLVPIFKYQYEKQAVEVTIINKERVYSVDFLPSKNGVYKIRGVANKKDDIEFPYFGKNESLSLVEINNNTYKVNPLPGYQSYSIKDEEFKAFSDSFIMSEDDVIQMRKGDIDIFIRSVEAPPKVKSPPFFSRDKDLKKYIALFAFFMLLPVIALNFYTVDKDIEKEKELDRIARILYKQPLVLSKSKAIEKTKEKPKKVQKTKKKVSVKKPEKPKPTEKQPEKKVVKKVDTPKPVGEKTAPKVVKTKQVRKPLPKVTNKPAVAKSANKTPKVTTKSAARSRVQKATKPNPGKVETFKAYKFKSTVASSMVKGSSVPRVKSSSGSLSTGSANSISSGVDSNVKTVDATSEVGSLTGSASGKLTASKGVSSSSSNKGIMTAGIPTQTVILGSMDPDIIRRILREHIPQFRYCYQKALDNNGGKKISDTVKLDFQIGASGHVTRAAVEAKELKASTRGCVASVLRGIQFPPPRGGGVVDVRQPINFYPVER